MCSGVPFVGARNACALGDESWEENVWKIQPAGLEEAMCLAIWSMSRIGSSPSETKNNAVLGLCLGNLRQCFLGICCFEVTEVTTLTFWLPN